MNTEKQIEMHELAKQMSEAISTAVEQRYIKDEAKLEAVLRANGWCKASDIFEEIEKHSEVALMNGHIETPILCIGFGVFAELKKKYLGKDINVSTKESEIT